MFVYKIFLPTRLFRSLLDRKNMQIKIKINMSCKVETLLPRPRPSRFKTARHVGHITLSTYVSRNYLMYTFTSSHFLTPTTHKIQSTTGLPDLIIRCSASPSAGGLIISSAGHNAIATRCELQFGHINSI